MGRIWLITDTHFGLKGDNEEWLNDYVGYFKDTVIPFMRKEYRDGDILVHCGDVFDNRATVGLNTLTDVIYLFEDFASIFKDIRITVGNHDSMKKSSNDVSSVNILKDIPNIKIYYEPEVETICGKTILFNPWIEDLEKEKRLLQSVDVDYIFGHLSVGGSQTCSKVGVKMKLTAGVSVSDFKNAQVYAGHIHIKQDMKNVHYLGNPYHKDRGDIGNPKGITILDIETGKTEFIENTYSPRYMKESIYDILDFTIGDLKERWNKGRINLYGNSEDINVCNFDMLRESLCSYYREFNPVGEKNVTILNEDSKSGFETAKTGEDYVEEFLDQQDMEPEFRRKVMEKLESYRDRL